jgi:hypothetical protein
MHKQPQQWMQSLSTTQHGYLHECKQLGGHQGTGQYQNGCQGMAAGA